MSMRSPLLKVALTAVTVCAVTISWAQGPTHPHVHGQAQLEVVLEGGDLQISLLSPLDSIVGFEHRPRTAAQRQAAAAALRVLADPASLVVLPAAAGCTLTQADLSAPELRPEVQPAAPSSHADVHADLEARWHFQCTSPDRLDRLQLRLFEPFATLRRLDVQTVGPVGQFRHIMRRGGAAELRLRR